MWSVFAWCCISSQEPRASSHVWQRQMRLCQCAGWSVCAGGTSDLSHSMTKPTKWPVQPTKTKISLGVRPVWVWSESLLSAWRNLGSLATNWAHSEEWSDWVGAQADQSLHWAHRSFCWFCHAAAHFVGFDVLGLLSFFSHSRECNMAGRCKVNLKHLIFVEQSYFGLSKPGLLFTKAFLVKYNTHVYRYPK